MRANEEGIKADSDMEFLHDYRTAVRRTRSALSQIPDVFPPETTERYKEAFGLLGEQSNRLRDLDVYLLSEPEYRAMFPEAMRDHIAPLLQLPATTAPAGLTRSDRQPEFRVVRGHDGSVVSILARACFA